MKKCDDCDSPAQWVMLWVKRFPYTDEEKQKKLIPRGPVFELAGNFCTAHKETIEQVPANEERVFRFSGAVVT